MQVLPEGKLPWACKRLSKFSTSRNVAVAPTPASPASVSITGKGFTSDAFWDWKLRMKFRKAWHGLKSSSGLHAVRWSDSLCNTHITIFMNIISYIISFSLLIIHLAPWTQWPDLWVRCMMFVFLFRFVMDGVDILLLYASVCYLNLFHVLYHCIV